MKNLLKNMVMAPAYAGYDDTGRGIVYDEIANDCCFVEDCVYQAACFLVDISML